MKFFPSKKTQQQVDSQSQAKDLEIKDLEQQVEDIENEKASSDFIPFVIGAFITLLLTFYLWAFYSASGYAAFGKIDEQISGFAGIFAALSQAMNEGGFVAVLTVLFPTVFLGLGFLIHDSLDKKKYGLITVLLIFTFCFDAMLGYIIAGKLHTNAFNLDEVTVSWDKLLLSEKLSDPIFYFILASGFVCYIMWGFLLNYTLNQWKEMQPDRRLKKLRLQLLELHNQKTQLIAEFKNLENQIKKKLEEINDYKNGKVDVDITALKANIGHFMSGWSAWTNLMKEAQAESLIEKGQRVKDIWLANKILALENSNPISDAETLQLLNLEMSNNTNSAQN